MQLVLSGRHQPALHRLREPHPHVAVTKISGHCREDKAHTMDAENGVLRRLASKQPERHAGHQPGTRYASDAVQEALNRVRAVEGERGEDLTRVVHLVEGPEDRNLVQGKMRDEPAEVPQHEEHERVAEAEHPRLRRGDCGDAEDIVEGGGDLYRQPHRSADDGNDTEHFSVVAPRIAAHPERMTRVPEANTQRGLQPPSWPLTR